jgi:LuxR family maltose regulon positive regulatory protein
MIDTILTTKLYLPSARPNTVRRPHLIERLNAGLKVGHALTFISAPAGYGKTTLISEWVRNHERPVAWLSLDEADDRLSRFFAYTIAALQYVDENIGQALQDLLEISQPPDTDVLMTRLINAVAVIATPFFLVLDDYQMIDEQDIHTAVAFLLDHQPPQLHLVIATREDPPLPLSRLRARGLITEIRESDLRFTKEEAAAFLRQTMGVSLTVDESSALQTHTEGWITGLQLAAISMQGRQDPHGLVQSLTGTDRHILDYLTDEVLRRQTENHRSFLLQTSILDRLSGTLCHAVTGLENSQDIIEHLQRANLFLMSLDNERCWYRYHHLFRDLLGYHLMREMGPQEIAALHRRACAWLTEHNLKTEALDHAIAGEDFETAADLIEVLARAVILRGDEKTVLRWLEALPVNLVLRRPYLCIVRAWALNLTEEVNAEEPHLQNAERALRAQGLPDDDPFVSDLRGHIAAMRASDARRMNNIPLSIQLSKHALELLSKDDSTVRTVVTQNLGMAHMLNLDLRAASRTYLEAQALGKSSGNIITVINSIGFLAAVLIAQGRLRQAAALCSSTIDEHLESHLTPLPTLGHVHASLARVLYEWDDLEEAAAHLERSVELRQLTRLPSSVRFGASLLDWIRQIHGKEEGVTGIRQQIAEMAEREQRDLEDVDFTAWRVQSWIAHGKLVAAETWAEKYQAGQAQPPPWRPYGDLALARTLIAQGRLTDALDVLVQVRKLAGGADGTDWVIKSYVLEAMALQTMNETADALDALSQAMSLGEPECYVRAFVDEGEPMAALLRQAGLQSVASRYVDRLLSAFCQLERASGRMETAARQAVPSSSALVESLTDRELEVLRLIDAGLSNREIAERLVISLNTVTTHTKGLYGKLNVHSRTQAVNRARDLGLL